MSIIWDSIWEKDSYSDPKLRKEKANLKLKMFQKSIELNEKSICVDIGCGGGYISKEIYDHYHCMVYSCDASYKAIEFANIHNSFSKSNYFVSTGDKTGLPDSMADVVLCIGVLEHIKNINDVIVEIRRILKPGGKLVIISSNYYSFIYWDRIIKQLFGKWKYGYQKNWKPKEFSQMLAKNNISIANTKIIQGFGDFRVLNKIDSIFNCFVPIWGRYFQIIGDVKK